MTISLLTLYKMRDFFRQRKERRIQKRIERTRLEDTLIECIRFEPLQTGGDVCIYSSFDADSTVPGYVLEQLRFYHGKGFQLVFVTTSATLTTQDKARLRQFCSAIVHRKNLGLDFCSWKHALVHFPEALESRRLILTNDSVFGPFKDFLSDLDVGRDEVWGITDSYQRGHHLQSYFLLFPQEILQSEVFRCFFDGVVILKSKDDIVRRYEVGLSLALRKEFRLRALYPYREILLKYTRTADFQFRDQLEKLFDPTQVFWDGLLADGFPFLKRSLLTQNQYRSAKVNYWFTFVANDDQRRLISDYLEQKNVEIVY